MNKFKSLPKEFDLLAADEKKILYVLSVIYQPVEITQLNKIFSALSWVHEKGGARLTFAKPQREALIKTGLLKSRRNKFHCAPEVVEYISQTYGNKTLFKEVAEASKKEMPIGQLSYYSDHELILRQFREWLYLDNEERVWQSLSIENPVMPADFDDINQLNDILLPINFSWLRERGLSVQIQALIPLINHHLLTLKSVQALVDRLQEQRAEGYFADTSFTYALIKHQLLTGKSFDLGLLSDDYTDEAYILRGWNSFLQHDNEIAIGYFTEAFAAKRKTTRKRAITLTGFGSIFYSLALLKSGTTEHLSALRTHCKYVNKIDDEPESLYIHSLISYYLTLQSARKPESTIMGWGRENLDGGDTYLVLIFVATLKWQGESVPASLTDLLSKVAHEAQKNGFLWYANEAATLLKALDKSKKNKLFPNCEKIANKASKGEYPPILCNLVKTIAPWERALSALELLAPNSAAGTTGTVPSEARLIWWIEPQGRGHYTLVPREQKRNKNGTWSKGRAVALKRLRDETAQIDYLTDDDKKISDTIRKEVDYGYFARTSYSLPDKQSFLAAIGHPHIYWPNDYSQAVSISQTEPELHLQKTDKALLIELTPQPREAGSDNQGGISIQKYNQYEIHLTVFTPQHHTISGILGREGLTVPLDAEKKVLQSLSSIAPLLTIHSDIAGLETGAEAVEPNNRLQLHLQPLKQGLKISCYSQPFMGGGPLFVPGEGRATAFAEIEGIKYQTTRVLDDEKKQFQKLTEQCPSLMDASLIESSSGLLEQGNEWQLEEPEQALPVLQELQEQQARTDNIDIHWPKGSPIKLRNAKGTEQMQVSIRKQRDWFAIDGALDIGDGDVLSLQNLMELMQQSPGRFVRLKDGDFLALTEDLQKRLNSMAKLTDKGRFHPLASPVLDDITADMQVAGSKPWQQQQTRLEEAYQLAPVVPSTLQAELRSYQVEGYVWLSRLAHWGAGACLADDMGLGKTLQALALILSRAANGPTLVLAPTSVCFNWGEEALRFAPTLNVKHFGRGDRKKMLESAAPFDLFICSYGLLQTEDERLKETHWHTLIADEAQAIKNPQTKRSKAAMALNADFRMVATGTPIENHLGELWNLFHFINPGLLGSLDTFNQRFASAIENDQNHQVRLQLKQLIQPFILRRLKSDVLTELPARTEVTLHVEQSPEEKSFYEALRRNALKNITESKSEKPGQQRIKMLAEIMRLRRACCHPQLVMPSSEISSAKLAVFGETLDELLENKHKALVFSQFVGHLSILRNYLDTRGITYQYLDGSTPEKKRQKAVNAFQSGEGDVFLISLKAGGSGLNLTAADYVIHMDPWWNPAVEDQASDRAHRMGQKRPVTIYRLVTNETIEAKIVAMHGEKRDLASNLLEGTEMSGKISLEDMVNLIKDI